MAKDFDFIPAKRSPQKQATRPAPNARPLAKKPAAPKRPSTSRATHKPTAVPAAPKRVQTRSSLIDYHPLEIPSRTKKAASPTAGMRTAPPYLPPARTIPTPKATLTKKRLNKKTVISAVLGFMGIVLLASGMLIPLLENPSVTIIIYIIAAIIFRLNSRVSFSIALLLLLAIPVLLLLRNGALASTYAIFCFYFLVVGVISATIELRNSDR